MLVIIINNQYFALKLRFQNLIKRDFPGGRVGTLEQGEIAKNVTFIPREDSLQ